MRVRSGGEGAASTVSVGAGAPARGGESTEITVQGTGVQMDGSPSLPASQTHWDVNGITRLASSTLIRKVLNFSFFTILSGLTLCSFPERKSPFAFGSNRCCLLNVV